MPRKKPQRSPISETGQAVGLGVSHTFSSLFNRELIAVIREFESAKDERDRANEANNATEKRFARVSRRFQDLSASVNGAIDEGITLVFEGKHWTFDIDTDGTPLVYANTIVVLTD